MRLLGQTHGFEPLKQPVCTDAPGDRKTLVYTLVKEVWNMPQKYYKALIKKSHIFQCIRKFATKTLTRLTF